MEVLEQNEELVLKKIEILTADQPDLENMPDRVSVEQKKYGQYAIFWPLNEDQPVDNTTPRTN